MNLKVIKKLSFMEAFTEIILSTKDRELLMHSYDDSLEIGQKKINTWFLKYLVCSFGFKIFNFLLQRSFTLKSF